MRGVRYPRPDWRALAARIDKTSPKNKDAAWSDAAAQWLGEICEAAGGKYGTDRSKHFIVMSALDKRAATSVLEFAERARRAIHRALTGLANTGGFGLHAILVFETEDEYYEYIAPYYPEGHYAVSAGVYLNEGYGHLVVPRREPGLLEPVLAHELAHALLSHLPLPRWLDEGVAVNLESVLCPRSARRLEVDWIGRHQRWWNRKSVQLYWSGHAFHVPGKLSELSYELAWVWVRSLAEDYEAFRAFALEASSDDAGQASAIKHLGGRLGHQFEALLGEGNWDPDPSQWERDAQANAA